MPAQCFAALPDPPRPVNCKRLLCAAYAIDGYTAMAYIGSMELIETPIFSRQVDQQLSSEEYRALQLQLILHPEAGPVIPGSGGLRKLRWRLPGRGKRGGARVIYYWVSVANQVYLVFLYPKNVRSDLTPAELRTLRKLVSEE